MKTLKARVRDDNIRAESVMTDPPDYAESSGWERSANWYSVTLKRKRRQLTVPFGMGSGLTDEPTAEDVLNALLSDASGYENAQGFEDWASEYGYDTDSRKAEQTYHLVRIQTQNLREFLGDAFDEYVWNTEPL